MGIGSCLGIVGGFGFEDSRHIAGFLGRIHIAPLLCLDHNRLAVHSLCPATPDSDSHTWEVQSQLSVTNAVDQQALQDVLVFLLLDHQNLPALPGKPNILVQMAAPVDSSCLCLPGELLLIRQNIHSTPPLVVAPHLPLFQFPQHGCSPAQHQVSRQLPPVHTRVPSWSSTSPSRSTKSSGILRENWSPNPCCP